MTNDKLRWKTEKRKLYQLKGYEFNPRTLSDNEYAALKKSLERFDLAEIPAINTDNKIIAGHQRIKILSELYGGDHTIDVRVPNRKLTNKEFQEYNIRSNKNTGSWDFDILANNFEIDDLFDWGFKENELDINLWQPNIDENKLDDVPLPNKKAITKQGDIFLLNGKHRVMCGDSTLGDDVTKLMNNKKANLIVTSPPYWVGKEYEREKTEDEINSFISESVKNFVIAVDENYSRIIINTGTSRAASLKNEKNPRTILLLDKWVNEFYKHNWYLRHIRHWIKGGGSLNGHRPKSPIVDVIYQGIEYLLTFYCINGKSRGQNKVSEGWAQQSNWTDINGDRQENRAGYPVELPIRYIKLYSLVDEIIFEPYAGNGTNFIACEQTKRICYGMEIEPVYVDVILKRYHQVYPEHTIECLTRKDFNFKKLLSIDR